MKFRIEELNCFYYPDLMIDCGAFDKKSVYTKTPSIIFEVLSRSTASTDRREKLVAYRHALSVTHYVIVHQTSKRLEVLRKIDDEWSIQVIGSGESLELEICDDTIKIPMNRNLRGYRVRRGSRFAGPRGCRSLFLVNEPRPMLVKDVCFGAGAVMRRN